MSTISNFIRLLGNPCKMAEPFARRGLLNWMSDEMYLKMRFRGEMGKKLNLGNPQTFNEKLQWLKLYDHNPEYTDLVDKIKAKEKIGKIIGEEYIVPMYTSWSDANKIDFKALPQQFVLKCNHDQGSVIIVSDKNDIDILNVKKWFDKKLKKSPYPGTRELPYKNIKPMIFAEKYLGGAICDYKFYCFNGQPLFLYVGQGLTEDHSLKIDFFDMDWKLMPFYRNDYMRLGMVDRPRHFEKMVEIAKKLSQNVPFVRIDLFEEDNRVYFSEFTLYPGSGYMPFSPPEYDVIVGNLLKF